MKLIYIICETVIATLLISATVSHFFRLTDAIGTWATIRIAFILLLNSIWYIIRINITDKTDRITLKKSLVYLILPTVLSFLLFWGTGLPYHKVDRSLAYWWNSRTVSPFTYSGLGWQNNCPRVYKGVKGKRRSINEATICFSLTAPACTGNNTCSVLVKIKSRKGWEILGIGIKASQPEKVAFHSVEQIENPNFHQYSIKELPCNDKILFICSLRRISQSWLTPDIESALSLSFSKIEYPKRKGGGG